MKTLLTSALLALVTFASGTARADQCAVFNKKAAEKLSAVVDLGDKYVAYCKTCGDAVPGPVTDVKTAEVMDWQGHPGFYQFFVNGAAVDLAYVFKASLTPGKFYNVGKLVGCANNSPATVDLEASKGSAMLQAPGAVPAVAPATAKPTTDAEIGYAFNGAKKAVASCMRGKTSGGHGTVVVGAVVAGDTGRITEFSKLESYVGNPKGTSSPDAKFEARSCVEAALKNIEFPKFAEPTRSTGHTFNY